MKTRIFIIDDHPIVIEGLTTHIDRQADMQVAGSAGDAETALPAIAKLKPDLVILDLMLRERNALGLIKTLRQRHPETQILVYSMHDETTYAERCLRAGAMGYVMKGEGMRRLLEAIRQVRSGSFFFSAALLGSIVAGDGARSAARGEANHMLSDRQLEVFELVGRGFDSHEIAEKLKLSPKTIDAHKANIRQKLGLAAARDLLMEAMRWVEK